VASKWEEKSFPLEDVVKRESLFLPPVAPHLTKNFSFLTQFSSRSSLSILPLLEPSLSFEYYATSPSTLLELEEPLETFFVRESKLSGRSSSRTRRRDRRRGAGRLPSSVGTSSTTLFSLDRRGKSTGSRCEETTFSSSNLSLPEEVGCRDQDYEGRWRWFRAY